MTTPGVPGSKDARASDDGHPKAAEVVIVRVAAVASAFILSTIRNELPARRVEALEQLIQFALDTPKEEL